MKTKYADPYKNEILVCVSSSSLNAYDIIIVWDINLYLYKCGRSNSLFCISVGFVKGTCVNA